LEGSGRRGREWERNKGGEKGGGGEGGERREEGGEFGRRGD